MCIFPFISTMALPKLILLLVIFHIVCIPEVTTECSNTFSNGNDTGSCYYYKRNPLSWSDAYNQCLTRTLDGILIQIFSIEQFNTLKNANIDQTSAFWLGANNFASFHDVSWHWLDGSVVDASVITWCPQSTYDVAIGAQCAAYDSALQCVNNYLCSSLLPAPCASATAGVNKAAKTILISRQTGVYICTNSFGGAYGNWWTYSILLINCTILLTVGFTILSFIMMMIFAILWGVQYQDIIQIPLAIVILGSLADVCLLIVILIVLNDRTRVQRYMACMILLIVIIVLESFLLLGLILCVAYCSGYITLASTSVDKDIIASLLASLIAAISVLLYTGVLYLLDSNDQDRMRAIKPATVNVMPVPATHALARPSYNNLSVPNHRLSQVAPVKKPEQIERATSPVDDRIINEFYCDQPKDVHQYTLNGRQYVVYEAPDLTDIETYQKELTQAMLLQDPHGLHEAINRAKSSIHASSLVQEIRQAESLATKIS